MRVPKASRTLLESKREILLGLSQCRVHLGDGPSTIRCARCWVEGHRASTCKGPDRSSLCRRCGTDGHKEATCNSAQFCPVCKEAGHRAFSVKCPSGRKETVEKKSDADRAAPVPAPNPDHPAQSELNKSVREPPSSPESSDPVDSPLRNEEGKSRRKRKRRRGKAAEDADTPS